MTNVALFLAPHRVRRLLALVEAQPGLTVAEHEAAARVVDRYMVATGLVSLVNACQVRRDDSGRLWPI
ncbi:hypothetical protein ABZ379_10515 [Streptomyces canus]|uniref:hypothetical protein n=1 Tax=Streptomyces canus TaxID=58343 RepID=UPI0033EEE164